MAEATAKQERIITALIESRTLSEVSRVTGTPPRTLYTILKDPAFKARLNEGKANALIQATTKLNDCTAATVDVLVSIAQDEATNAQVRVSACRALLDTVTRLNEQIDIIARLDELERLQADNSRN